MLTSSGTKFRVCKFAWWYIFILIFFCPFQNCISNFVAAIIVRNWRTNGWCSRFPFPRQMSSHILWYYFQLFHIQCFNANFTTTFKHQLSLPLLLHRASCRFTKYHTTNKRTNCISFILNHFFKTLFTAPTCFDSISLIIIREHV